MFDWENAITLHAMQGNRATSHGEREVSWVFSSCGRNLGYIVEFSRGCPLETGVCSVKSGHLSRYSDTSDSYTRLGSKIWMLLDMRREARRPLLVGTVRFLFLSIFTENQSSSPFEALNSAQPSMCQRDVNPSVQKLWRTMAFSRVSTGYSVIPSSFEMKDEPAFKPLQGKPAFL